MSRPVRPSSIPLTWGSPLRRLVAASIAVLLVTVLASCVAPPVEPRRLAESAKRGLWIGPAEIARLPTSGGPWDQLVAEARGPWGSPSLADNNADHDTSTLAGALVAARTGDPAMRSKTRAAIMSVTRVRSYARVLEMSRNITSYVIAADVVGLSAPDDATFRRFIAGLRTQRLQGHSGGVDLVSTALRSPNNWGAMARAALTAIDLYLGDVVGVRQVADAHRAWLGEPVPSQLRWSDTGWHASPAKAGINRRGARIRGRDVDGVLPEDQRRTGEPGSGAAARGSYPWEALQGALVTGVLLDRAGVVGIRAGDSALVRAFTWLYSTDRNPPSGDDRWQPWVLNRVAGTHFATQPAGGPGKNMGWSDWTHGPRA